MPKGNVTRITPNSVPLEGVKAKLNAWRASKKRANEGIPIVLWKQIVELLGPHTETEIRSVLRLSPTQLERGSALIEEAERLNRENNVPNASKASVIWSTRSHSLSKKLNTSKNFLRPCTRQKHKIKRAYRAELNFLGILLGLASIMAITGSSVVLCVKLSGIF